MARRAVKTLLLLANRRRFNERHGRVISILAPAAVFRPQVPQFNLPVTQYGGIERAQPPKSPRTRTRLGAARRIVGDRTMITERRIQAELRNVEGLAR